MNLSLHSYLDILNINAFLQYGLLKKVIKNPYILCKGFQSPLLCGLEQSF